MKNSSWVQLSRTVEGFWLCCFSAPDSCKIDWGSCPSFCDSTQVGSALFSTSSCYKTSNTIGCTRTPKGKDFNFGTKNSAFKLSTEDSRKTLRKIGNTTASIPTPSKEHVTACTGKSFQGYKTKRTVTCQQLLRLYLMAASLGTFSLARMCLSSSELHT